MVYPCIRSFPAERSASPASRQVERKFTFTCPLPGLNNVYVYNNPPTSLISRKENQIKGSCLRFLHLPTMEMRPRPSSSSTTSVTTVSNACTALDMLRKKPPLAQGIEESAPSVPPTANCCLRRRVQVDFRPGGVPSLLQVTTSTP